MYFTILQKTFRSLCLPPLWGVALLSLGVTVIALIAFIIGMRELFALTSFFNATWLESASDFIGSVFAVLVAWFLFPVLTPVIASLFSDKIGDIIEKNDYPGQQKATPIPVGEAFLQACSFLLKMLGLNLLCLPLYFVPGINIAVYYSLNAYLLGREFFDMVSERYLDMRAGKTLRRDNRGIVFLAGLLIALATTLPIANLGAPILGIVLMMHVFFAARGREAV